jgi:hypothetical protein
MSEKKYRGTCIEKHLTAVLNAVKSGKPLTVVGQDFSSIFWNSTTNENCI